MKWKRQIKRYRYGRTHLYLKKYGTRVFFQDKLPDTDEDIYLEMYGTRVLFQVAFAAESPTADVAGEPLVVMMDDVHVVGQGVGRLEDFRTLGTSMEGGRFGRGPVVFGRGPRRRKRWGRRYGGGAGEPRSWMRYGSKDGGGVG